MASQADQMVRDAIKAYRANHKSEARLLLEQATEADPENEQAWMWLSAVVDTVDDQRICLENVLYLNPNNQNAKKGLEILNQKSPTTTTTSDAPADNNYDDAFASASFSDQSTSSPFTTSVDDNYAPPTETSSASSNFSRPEPEPEEYDDWVSNLGINDDSSTNPDFESEQILDKLDFTNAFSDDSVFDEDESGNSRLDAMMGSGDDMLSGPFSADPFTTDDIDFSDSGSSSDSAGAFIADSSIDELEDFNFDDDPLGGDFLGDVDDTPEPISQKSSPMSPSEKRPKSRSRASSSDLSMDELDPAEYFRAIPRGIKATRLPGSGEAFPIFTIIGFIVLVLLNIGAGVFLMMTLS